MKRMLVIPAAAATMAACLLPAGRPDAAEEARKAKCPVSGKEVAVTEKTPKLRVQGKALYFCCENCPKAFAKTPEKFIKEVGDCPVLGSKVEVADAAQRVVVNNGLWYVCCPGCSDGVVTSTVVRKSLEDVVSKKPFTATGASPSAEFAGQHYFFQSAETKAAFDKEPAKYALVYGK